MGEEHRRLGEGEGVEEEEVHLTGEVQEQVEAGEAGERWCAAQAGQVVAAVEHCGFLLEQEGEAEGEEEHHHHPHGWEAAEEQEARQGEELAQHEVELEEAEERLLAAPVVEAASTAETLEVQALASCEY